MSAQPPENAPSPGDAPPPGAGPLGANAAAEATVTLGAATPLVSGAALGASLDEHPDVPGFVLVMSPPMPSYLVGGFGRVYRAKSSDGILVAIKVPRPEVSSGTTAELWAQECALSRAFPSHENVVRFFPREVARWPDGRVTDALVMEWLEGARGLIRYADSVGLDKPARVQLLLQAVEGVAWMHSHGTPHCDLKSDNMLVIERLGRPVVKVTDFGGTRTAQRLDPRGGAYTMTRAAPEVVQGDPAAITPRADVYSLAKECAELVGGTAAVRPAAGGDDANWRPTPTRQTLGLSDPQLDDVIEGGAQIEPRDRFASAEELRVALSAYRPPWIERATRWVERWVWPAARSVGSGPAPLMNRSRVPLALAVLVLLGTLFSFGTAYECIAVGGWPRVRWPLTAPTNLSRVLVVREKTEDGIERLAQRLGIEGVSASDKPTKRVVWGQIIRHLAAAHPDAIAVDIAFPHLKGNPAFNTVITEAIAEASHGAHPVPVVVATQAFWSGPPRLRTQDPLIDGLAESGAQFGTMSLSDLYLNTNSLIIPQRENLKPRLPLAVVAAAAALRGTAAAGAPMNVQLDAKEERLRFIGETAGGTSVGLAGIVPASDIRGVENLGGVEGNDSVGIYPVGVPSDADFEPIDLDVLDLVSVDGKWQLPDLRNRVVLLAGYLATDVVVLEQRTDGRRVPGVWFQAAAVQSLLSGIDAIRVSWWVLVPMLVSVAVGTLVTMPVAAWFLRWRGVPVPRLSGHFGQGRVAPRAMVVRWKRIVTAAAGCAIAVPLGVGLLSWGCQWEVSYIPGVCCVSVFVGAMIGVGVVCAGAWMGCVRRAWCLDRAPVHN